MPEYLSGKRKKLGVGIKSYSENTDTVSIIGNVAITSGKLGLGITNPQSILHVSSGDNGDAVLILEADKSNTNEENNPRIIFRQDGGTDVSSIGFTDNTLDISNSAATNSGIRFLTNSGANYTDAIERVRINSAGNVGIGTSVNFGKLDVIGDVIVSGRIGVNTNTPTQDVDLRTIRVREDLYDYYNSPGVLGYFLVKDNQGIKWVAVPPINSNAIFVSDNNSIVGVSSFIGINIVSEDNILGVSTNPLNPNIADIVYNPLWLKSGDTGIYTTRNVGIGTTIPLADFQVGFGTTGVTIDGSSGVVTAIGYDGYFANFNRVTTGFATVTDNLVVVGLGSTHFSAYLASSGGITSTGGDLYVGGKLFAGIVEFLTLEAQNLKVIGIATINNAVINSLSANSGTITTLTTTNLVGVSATITNFASTSSTINVLDVDSASIDSLVGIAGTFNTLRVNTGFITSISGSSANYTNFVGVAATINNLDVDFLNLDDLRVTGVSTLGGVKIAAGIVTAVSGIVTYYGRFVGDVEGYVTNAGLATVALYANLAGVATYARNAGVATYANSAGLATYAGTAGLATYASSAGLATYASSAGLATYASSAGLATYASSAGLATYANNAGFATYANNAGFATYADSSGQSTYTIISGFATYASSAGLATYASSAGLATYANNAGVATFANIAGYSTSSGIATLASGLTGTPNLNVGIVTATEYYGVFKGSIDSGVTLQNAVYAQTAGLATNATKLQTPRTFELTGDVVASPVSFDGTGNVSLAATIQPNSVGLGTDTFGDYVKSITGTANQITVTGASGEGSVPVVSIATDPILPGNVVVSGDLQVNSDLNVGGNITIGGTTAIVYVNEFIVKDKQIVLGFTTNLQGQEISNDVTANGGGISIASTEGNPLVDFNIVGVHTYPNTYKDIIWIREGTLGSGTTDAWHFNYAIGIGSTQVPNGVRLAAGNVQITQDDIPSVRNINASGIITANQFFGIFNGSIGNVTIQTSEFAKVAGFATFALNSGFSTYAATTGFSTYANSSGFATFSSRSGIASYAEIAGISSFSQVTGFSSYSPLSGVATFANTAGIATLAETSNVATYANNAGFATYANTAGIATLANTATTATYAISAGVATVSSTSDVATYAITAGVATYANNAGLATYANTAGFATFANIAGYSTSSGIATLASNLSGTPNLNVGIVTATEYYGSFKGTIDSNVIVGNALYAQRAGVATFANIAGYSTSSGIATLASNLSGTPNLNVGIVTATEYYGVFKGSIDNAVSSNYAQNAGVATYANTAGYSTSSGIATLASGLTGTPNLNVGIVTATEYYGVFKGSIDANVSINYANKSGVSTFAVIAGYSTNSGIATFANRAGVATYADNAGIATFANTAGVATFANTVGVATFATITGIATNVIGGIASVTSLSVSGISTLGTVQISAGIVTAAIGVVTYYGDGRYLTGVAAFSVVNQTLTTVPTYVTIANNIGVSSLGISTSGQTSFVFLPSTGAVGLGTTSPREKLDVIGNALVSGNLGVGGSILNPKISGITTVIGIVTSYPYPSPPSGGLTTSNYVEIKPYARDYSTMSFQGYGNQMLTVDDDFGTDTFAVYNYNSKSFNSITLVDGVYKTSSFDANYEQALRITRQGNVIIGIGTTVTAKLDVRGNVNLGPVFGSPGFIGTTIVHNITGTTNFYGDLNLYSPRIKPRVAYSPSFISTSYVEVSPNTADTGSLNFYVGTSSTTLLPNNILSLTNNISDSLFRVNEINVSFASTSNLTTATIAPIFEVNANNNVGVGTTRPTSKLHVVGNALITGITTVGLGSTSSPTINSTMSFELTNSTTLTVRVRDGSGTVRTGIITLS